MPEVCIDCLPVSFSETPAPPRPPLPTSDADPALDPTTFSPPILAPGLPGEELPRVIVEFCDRCRWLHRATWTLTELFLTFPPTTTISPDTNLSTSTGLKAITLLPRSAPETGGRFRVWLYRYRTIEEEFAESEGREKWDGAELVWDRKIEGGFPEMKILKQRIRNLIAPRQALGHSDKDAFKGSKETAEGKVEPAPAPEEETVNDYEPRFRC